MRPLLMMMTRSHRACTSCMICVLRITVFLAEGLDEVADVCQLVGVEAGGGFIQDEHFGVVEHGLCKSYPLAITFTQLTDLLLRSVTIPLPRSSLPPALRTSSCPACGQRTPGIPARTCRDRADCVPADIPLFFHFDGILHAVKSAPSLRLQRAE